MARERVSETYHAALVHGFADVGDATRIGVVRQPTAGLSGSVDENRPELGPPEELMEGFERRHEDLKMRGMCDEGAHNAAWDEVGFEERYRNHLGRDAAEEVLSELVDRIAAGERLVLVCYGKSTKRCHRHLLVEVIESRLDSDT
ncbi:DUF488 domain-containing protein [Halalkalicoccus subterraneus]|uniref:DUF488 domain-containing protein n=1 Tax=Halalkalicoccus subterraneus TaxID=2675002 RepID=UPI000EFCABCD|nr:DUF488 domain-containing protein [Halalkalicoccus subterraneus]